LKEGVGFLFDENRLRRKITVPNKGYGVVIEPESDYKYPEGHPCHGCVFIFRASKPSCLTGDYPDAENCVNAFYKKIQARWSADRQARLAKEE
jgi:hypothetical protein